jgi:hypothetical protein
MSLLLSYGYERKHPGPWYESLIYFRRLNVDVHIHRSEEILVIRNNPQIQRIH